MEACPMPGLVHIRDSKQTGGPRLTFAQAGWTAFANHITGRTAS